MLVHASGPKPSAPTNFPTFATTCNPPPAPRGTRPFEQGGARTDFNSSGTAQVISSTDTKDRVGRQWWETSHVSANLWTTHGFAPQAVQGWQVGGGINYRGVQPPMNYTGAPAQTASDYAQVQSRTLVDLMPDYRLQVQRARVSMQLDVTNLFNRRYFSYIFLNNPGAGTSYTYAGQIDGFDFRLYGDPQLVTGALKVEF